MIKEFFEEAWMDIQPKILVARNQYVMSILISFLFGGIPILFSINTINAIVVDNAVSNLGFLLIYAYVLTGYLFATKIAPYSFLSFLSISKEFLEERLVTGDD